MPLGPKTILREAVGLRAQCLSCLAVRSYAPAFREKPGLTQTILSAYTGDDSTGQNRN